MNRASFRRFEFFDVDTISEDICTELGCIPTCAVAEGGMLIFGDEAGNIVVADRDFQVTERRSKVFKGKVKGLAYLLDPLKSNRQYIVAIGEDARPNEVTANASQVYAIKIFATTDMARPMYVLNASVVGGTLTAFAVQQDGNEIAVGYSNGRVMLFLGQFLKEGTQKSPPAPIVLLEQHTYPIAALNFCDAPSKADDRSVRLFVTLDTKQSNMENADELIGNVLDEHDLAAAGIIVFDTSYTFNVSKTAFILNPNYDAKALDGRGAPSLCTTFMRGSSELILARNEAVCAYTIDDRAGAMAIPGEKMCLASVGRYALVVSIDDKPTAGTAKAKRPNVTIYDLKHKIICGTFKRYYLPVNERVNFVMHDGGVVYLVTSSMSLIRFREKDTMKKLDVLLNQIDPPLYSLAITIAAEEQLETAEIMKLYKSYGDHLYAKHDYDNAVVQYCSTIGYLPSSYVVIKYLDPYRIHNLILYLERLKDKSMASSDHFTLLLNAYCKLKSESSINALLDHLWAQAGKLESLSNSTGSKPPGKSFFDAPTAIKLLTSAGFVEQALRVAIRFQQHKAYLDMQLNKLPAPFDDILGYIMFVALTCPVQDLLSLLHSYARDLVKERGKAFTHIMILLCTGEIHSLLQQLPLSQTQGASSAQSLSSANSSSSTKSLAGNMPAGGVINNAGTATATVGGLSLPVEVLKAVSTISAMSGLSPSQAANKEPLCPSTCTHFFIDDNTNLLYFLESVQQKLSKTRIFPPKVWHTLLELNMQTSQQLAAELAQSNSSMASETTLLAIERNIHAILDGPNANYSLPHVLLLCYIYDFSKGIIFLLEKSHDIYTLLDIYLKQKNPNDLFALLRKMSNKQPEIFVKVLTYFVNKSISPRDRGAGSPSGSAQVQGQARAYDSDDDVREEGSVADSDEDEDDESKWDTIMDLLDLIEKDQVLSAAQVLNILALNPRLPLRVVSQYIASSFREVTEGLSGVEGEVQEALKQLESAAASATTEKVAKPVVKVEKRRGGYDDYDDDEDDEDEDIRKHNEEKDKNKWLDIQQSRLTRANQHEVFFRDLENSSDGFSTVANYYGLTVISYNNA